MFAIHCFPTWRPLLRSAFDCDQKCFSHPGAGIAGRVTRDNRMYCVFSGRGGHIDWFEQNFTEEIDDFLFASLQAELRETPMDGISFVATYPAVGHASLQLIELSSAVDTTVGGTGLGSVVLVEGAVPEFWQRQPVPVPGARPSRTADPLLLARTLRQRFPGAAGASDAEITAAGNRIGTVFPAELRAFYRALPPGASRRDIGVPFDPLPLDEVFVGTATARWEPWTDASEHPAPPTAPGAAVQSLAGSPGWLVFANAGDDGLQLAVDLTPGPGGHHGQIIMIHDAHWHAPTLVTDSLTQLMVHRRHLTEADPLPDLPVLARVGGPWLPDIESALSRDLEILCLYRTEGMPPFSLAAFAGHPRLRTLIAAPGTLADPRQIAALPQLEYVQIGVAEWRVLLREHLVPPTLLAAGVPEWFYGGDPVGAVEVMNGLLGRRRRPKIGRMVLEGRI